MKADNRRKTHRDLIREYLENNEGTSTDIYNYLKSQGAEFRGKSEKNKRKSVSGNLNKLFKGGEISRRTEEGIIGFIYYKKSEE